MNNPNFFPKKLIQRTCSVFSGGTCSVLSKHIQTAKSGVHPMIIRWHFFIIPVMLENQDLRPRLSPRPTSLLLHHHSPPTPIKSGWDIIKKRGSSPLIPPVTMFAYANELDRYVRCYSWGLRAPCRKAPPRCVFHIFLSIKVGTIIIGLYICKC